MDLYYSEETIEEVRSASDIVDVVSSYVKIQKRGAQYMGLCPFHNEKTPSFSVSPSKQMYYCFGCGAGGNVITFIMQYENLTFIEALKFLAERSNIALPQKEETQGERKTRSEKNILLEINKLAAMYFYHQLRQPQGDQARDYLLARGLSAEDIVHFGLGFSNKTSDDLYRYLKSKGYDDTILKQTGLVTVEERGSRDKFWNRVMFPILDVNSRVIGFGGRVMGDGMPKYLNSPETKLFDKSKNLYGLNFARYSRKEDMILCEGYMDVIALQRAGFVNAVASLGTALTISHVQLLRRYVKRVILAYDSDGAGINAARRAIGLLREAGMSARVLNMQPYKDPDEFIKNLGKDAYQERIDRAKNAFLWEIDVLEKEFDLHDPEQQTDFQRKVAERLCIFQDGLERENYMQAVCKEHFIAYEDMRRMVNGMGAQVQLQNAIQSQREKEREKHSIQRREKEDGIKKSQRLLLTWMIEDAKVFEKIKNYISPSDFIEKIYQDVATRIYQDYEKGVVNPAAILDEYMEDEELQKQITRLFHAELLGEVTEKEKKKAMEESILKLKLASLDLRAKSALSPTQFQEIILEQAQWRKKGVHIE